MNTLCNTFKIILLLFLGIVKDKNIQYGIAPIAAKSLVALKIALIVIDFGFNSFGQCIP